jgi:hypothetical protein
MRNSRIKTAWPDRILIALRKPDHAMLATHEQYLIDVLGIYQPRDERELLLKTHA